MSHITCLNNMHEWFYELLYSGLEKYISPNWFEGKSKSKFRFDI